MQEFFKSLQALAKEPESIDVQHVFLMALATVDEALKHYESPLLSEHYQQLIKGYAQSKGQILYEKRALSEQLNVSNSKLTKWMGVLRKEGIVELVTWPPYTFIHILKPDADLSLLLAPTPPQVAKPEETSPILEEGADENVAETSPEPVKTLEDDSPQQLSPKQIKTQPEALNAEIAIDGASVQPPKKRRKKKKRPSTTTAPSEATPSGETFYFG